MQGRWLRWWVQRLRLLWTGGWTPLERAVGVGAVTALGFGVVVGVVTGAIDTPWLERQTPAFTVDYPIWAANALLVGALIGVSVYAAGRRQFSDAPIYAGGLLSAFAIACPLCNGLLVAVIGAGAAASVIDPLRPWLGAAAAVFMAVMLYRRVQTLRRGAC